MSPPCVTRGIIRAMSSCSFDFTFPRLASAKRGEGVIVGPVPRSSRLQVLQLAQPTRRRSLITVAALAAVAVVVSFAVLGWSNVGSRHRAVPHELEVEAHLADFPDGLRYFPSSAEDIAFMSEEFADSWDREKAFLHVDTLPPTAYLALSGGGDKGAFSAGFLN